MTPGPEPQVDRSLPCAVEGCPRRRHHLDGTCKPCRKRLTWYPANIETERAGARDRRRVWREQRRAAGPQFFNPDFQS